MRTKQIYYSLIHYVSRSRTKYVYSKKIKGLLKGVKSKSLSRVQKSKVLSLFRSYGLKKVDLRWHKYYNSFYPEFSEYFISEILFYSKIEPTLNMSIMFPALEDKNILPTLFPKALQPINIVKNINGFFYCDNDRISRDQALSLCLEHKQIIMKPSIGSYGGIGVEKIDLSDTEHGKRKLIKLFEKYKSNYAVQEIILQNNKISSLNPASVNTIRILTYMREEEVVVLSSFIRYGTENSFLDNLSQGGYSCGINSDGTLKPFALNGKGEKFHKTESNVLLAGFKIPKFDDALKKVKLLHNNIPHFRIISWDIVITDNSEVLLIEFNALGQGINGHQTVNGPIFKPYFDEILKTSIKKKV